MNQQLKEFRIASKFSRSSNGQTGKKIHLLGNKLMDLQQFCNFDIKGKFEFNYGHTTKFFSFE